MGKEKLKAIEGNENRIVKNQYKARRTQKKISIRRRKKNQYKARRCPGWGEITEGDFGLAMLALAAAFGVTTSLLRQTMHRSVIVIL